MTKFNFDSASAGVPGIKRREMLIRTAVVGASAGLGNLLWAPRAPAGTPHPIDAVLTTAVQNQDVPFVVAMVGNANGVIYSGMAGDRAPGRVATLDTLFRIFSMTKQGNLMCQHFSGQKVQVTFRVCS
jgi:CubicO group peptidase (beta-lactamase class C family)